MWSISGIRTRFEPLLGSVSTVKSISCVFTARGCRLGEADLRRLDRNAAILGDALGNDVRSCGEDVRSCGDRRCLDGEVLAGLDSVEVRETRDRFGSEASPRIAVSEDVLTFRIGGVPKLLSTLLLVFEETRAGTEADAPEVAP